MAGQLQQRAETLGRPGHEVFPASAAGTAVGDHLVRVRQPAHHHVRRVEGVAAGEFLVRDVLGGLGVGVECEPLRKDGRARCGGAGGSGSRLTVRCDTVRESVGGSYARELRHG